MRWWTAPEFRIGHVTGPPLDAATGNLLIGRQLREVFAGAREPLMIARLSLGAEMSASIDYANGRRDYADLESLGNNAGVYPRMAEEATRFVHDYLSSLNASRIVARFGGEWHARETFILDRFCPTATFVANRALEPFYFQGDEPWSSQLAGRRVLVVHPFAATILSQYSKHISGRRLWADPDVLPRFELVTVSAYLTLADSPKPHASWSETLDALKRDVADVAPFDVALLGCGAYGELRRHEDNNHASITSGLPLMHHIHTAHGASAVYVGGAIQVLFGIKGRRWADRPDFANRYFNDAWVWPAANETPPGAFGVEGAAYWAVPTEVVA
ncbi:hypothetical protein CTAYLR_008545 [Chrysophaeum taylorii]|uniref:Uncharacterized protein n=1 Tax=Chrysophaeum taylorii TaxID=2483200 RepID=A0AAD7XGV9_9STRA|nr:hypothetical protein CTAYLR_008545 [Chrysophaeum taylorii]